MTWVAVAIGSSAVLGAGASIYSAGKAADAAGEGADQQIGFARESRDINQALTRPQREAGYVALNDLMGLAGLPSPESVQGAATGGDASLGLGGGQGGTAGPPAGLIAIPGATWQNRPVFTDGKGGIYSGRGRNWTAASGVSYLGQASEGNGLRFEGKAIKAGGGAILDYRDGQFYPGRGPRQQPLTLPEPTPGTNPATGAAVGGGGATGGTTGAAVDGTANERIAERVRSDPSYQFRLNEGTQALEASASARGGFGTPLNRKMTRYAQDYASTEYQRIFDRVSTIAGYGSSGTAQYGAAVSQFGQQAGAAAGNAAYTRASAYTAGGNAVSGALNQGAQALGYWDANRTVGGAAGAGRDLDTLFNDPRYF